MKAVSVDSLGAQFRGQRKRLRNRRQIGMEGRVEACDLRNTGEVLLRKIDGRQCRWRVKRREDSGVFEFPHDRAIDEAMLR